MWLLDTALHVSHNRVDQNSRRTSEKPTEQSQTEVGTIAPVRLPEFADLWIVRMTEHATKSCQAWIDVVDLIQTERQEQRRIQLLRRPRAFDPRRCHAGAAASTSRSMTYQELSIRRITAILGVASIVIY